MSALTPVAQYPVKNDTEDVLCEAVKLCQTSTLWAKFKMCHYSVGTCVKITHSAKIQLHKYSKFLDHRFVNING